MCRILGLISEQPIHVADRIRQFAECCKKSSEYQGDGWGLSWWDGRRWQTHLEIQPIWDSTFTLEEPVYALLVHARSAFEAYGVDLSYNMPFAEGALRFVFNGELRGVRLPGDGVSGAQNVFHLALKLHKSCWIDTIERLKRVLIKRSRRVRAANFILSDGTRLIGLNQYDSQEDYFSLWQWREPGLSLVSSERIGTTEHWYPIGNGSIFELGAEQ